MIGITQTSANTAGLKKWQTITVWFLRVLIGGTFLLSGLVKGIDLWGFLFKIEEYFAVWHIHQPRTVLLMAAMAISAYELVFGFLLMTGSYKRVAPWALTLSMAVMLPLTAYIAIAEPVSDCGCFGDFIVLSNTATFLKNGLITAALVFLLVYNPRVKSGLFKPAIQWLVATTATAYIVIIALYGYNIQPMLDFRPYAPGKMLVEDGTESEEPMPTYIYEKDGLQQEFEADALPDSTWTFVERRGVTPTTTPHSGIFAVSDNGTDVTADLFSGEGRQLLLVIPELRRADISYTYFINDLYQKADSAGIEMAALIGASGRGIQWWQDISMAAYPCYSAEDTALKEFSRGVMSLVLIDNGRIKGKSTVSSLVNGNYNNPNPLLAVASLSDTPHEVFFWFITAGFTGIILFIYLFQGIMLAIRSRLCRKPRKTPNTELSTGTSRYR